MVPIFWDFLSKSLNPKEAIFESAKPMARRTARKEFARRCAGDMDSDLVPDTELAKLPDRNPVKIKITVKPDLNVALQSYAALSSHA
jgi:hypothetical protein